MSFGRLLLCCRRTLGVCVCVFSQKSSYSGDRLFYKPVDICLFCLGIHMNVHELPKDLHPGKDPSLRLGKHFTGFGYNISNNIGG